METLSMNEVRAAEIFDGAQPSGSEIKALAHFYMVKARYVPLFKHHARILSRSSDPLAAKMGSEALEEYGKQVEAGFSI